MLLHAKQAERGAEVGYSPPHTLPWRWKRVADKPHATATLPPGNRTGIHYSAAWVEIGEGVDGSRKPRPPPTGVHNHDRPARSESLYRLRYQVSSITYLTKYRLCTHKNILYYIIHLNAASATYILLVYSSPGLGKCGRSYT